MPDDREAREERAMLAIAPHVFGLAPNGIERMKVLGIAYFTDEERKLLRELVRRVWQELTGDEQKA